MTDTKDSAGPQTQYRTLLRYLPVFCLVYVLYVFTAFRSPGPNLFERDGYFHLY